MMRPPAPPPPHNPGSPYQNLTFCHWIRKLRVLHLGGYRHAVLGIAILYGPPACKLSSISGYRFIVRILQKELLRTRSSSRKCSERRPKEAKGGPTVFGINVCGDIFNPYPEAYWLQHNTQPSPKQPKLDQNFLY